ncbi:MAG: tRNA (N6-isopentenyl adenosine(37)-C2)-methylthiotransferase MiaB [Bacilli bacterium]|jgi:tRNA-2-methylthio-N6-dimethylallyladenosine synthase|nr:tRNA (N6-isopentenyl adenosine(37)-C2)-methylthiotransferase MiaB [Bacilli bacterium]
MKHRLVSLPSLREAAQRSPVGEIHYEKTASLSSSFLRSWGQGKIFCIRTYGCQANVRDSEILRGYLLSFGLKESESFDDADLILFNTCAIRENAENHLYGELGMAKTRFEEDPALVVAVCGCVMQEEGPVKYVLAHYPFVSLIFGTNNLMAFPSLLEDSLRHHQGIIDVRPKGDAITAEPLDLEGSRVSSVSASVNIMYGCNKFCTYCIVPYTRGQERSRKEEDILNEVRCLKEKGYREVVLLGQNVDAYGKDFSDKYAFSGLLEKVAQTGIDRIRFVTPYPSDFNPTVFDVMARYPNIMPYLHLPVQSGSDAVLKAMNRHYTRAQYMEIVHQLRSRLPDVFLTTDIIVGFPSETEADFQETLSLVKEAGFDAAYTFIFSARPGTPASQMRPVSSEKEIHDRFDRLHQLLEEQTQARAETFLNKTVKVLFESVSKKDDGMITGLDPHGKLVHVKGDASLIGQIRLVKILESHTYSLIGEVVDD